MALISKYSEIMKRLRDEGKVQDVDLFSANICSMMHEMEKVMRESKQKQNASENSARNVWIF